MPIPLTELPAIHAPGPDDDSSLGAVAAGLRQMFVPQPKSSLYFEPLTARSKSLLDALALSSTTSLEAIREAARFLDLLPMVVPDPEVIVEDDGQVGLDWRENDKSLSLSLGKGGMIGYSALFGTESAYGRTPFSHNELLLESQRFLSAWLRNGKHVALEETVTRFVFDPRHLKPQHAFRSFIPSNSENHELSVCLTTGLVEERLWRTGDRIGKSRESSAIAARHLTPESVPKASDDYAMSVVHSVPPRRHSVILGWPPLVERDARKTIAMAFDRLAATARRPTEPLA